MDVVRYDIDDSEAREFFIYAGFRARDMRSPFSRLLTDIRFVVQTGFATESAVGGDKWAPLAPSTVKDRISDGFPGEHPILRRTGRLQRAALSAGHAYRTNLIYAPTLYRGDTDIVEEHFTGRASQGTSKKDKKSVGVKKGEPYGEMPARPFFVWNAFMAERTETRFMEWLRDIKERNPRRRAVTAPMPESPSPTFAFGSGGLVSL